LQSFRSDFEELTGDKPFRWQERLYLRFVEGDLPSAVDIPTGLGKTAVIVVWLIARARGAPVPRRLIYVVDRRAVVDQATTIAVKLQRNLDTRAAHLKGPLELNGRSLPISTLRGQHVDNREWLDDPVSTAIIVGTIDMIGSRLLFEGYGVSRNMRPYHAGLLGADTLVTLDEAHLAPSFERLLQAIAGDSKQFGARKAEHGKLIPALRLLSLSATGRDTDGDVFRLSGKLDLPPGRRGDLDDEIVVRRLTARKRITLIQVKTEQLADELASRAWRLSARGKMPIRCIVFSHRREVAEKAKQRLDELARGDGKRAVSAQQPETQLFVGARRVREREGVAGWLEDKGFIAGRSAKRTGPAFLFATSAGEVGVDLDADHMVCDLVPWERMVQRLGRVNRRGDGDARIVVLMNRPDSRANKSASASSDKGAAKQAARRRDSIDVAGMGRSVAFRKPLRYLRRLSDGSLDGSPRALLALKDKAASEAAVATAINAATTPAPLRPALTRALVDAWSMTCLQGHTGRPEVGPWLRGWVDETPQTTVVWRAHLPVRHRGGEATKHEIEEFFEAAPLHLSERLETETPCAEQWLRTRCAILLKTERTEKRTESSAERESGSTAEGLDRVTTVNQPLKRWGTVGFILSHSGERMETLILDDFAECEDKLRARRLEGKLRKLTNALLVVDARLRGLNGGLLDSHYAESIDTIDGCATWLSPVKESAAPGGRLRPVIKFRVRRSERIEADSEADWRERYRFALERDEDGVELQWLIVEKSGGDAATERDRSASRNPQLLVDHHSLTEEKMRALARRLGLPGALTKVLALAARLHDEGKKALRWQRAFRAPPDGPYAKTKGPINFAVLGAYRHEFGSLQYAAVDRELMELPEDLRDLALHLIASHHAQARPVIDTRDCEDAPPSVLEERARQVAQRFVRLQERWGPWGLAWLETLLRSADQQASRENDARLVGAV